MGSVADTSQEIHHDFWNESADRGHEILLADPAEWTTSQAGLLVDPK